LRVQAGGSRRIVWCPDRLGSVIGVGPRAAWGQ